MRSIWIGVLAASVSVGCTTGSTDREGRLLTLAAHEAQQIRNSQQRLTRQLNFAYRQSARGKNDEAKQSLGYAAQTLKDAKADELQPQIRIAGWISISELSRTIDDKATAKDACDQAVGVLRSLQPITDRPQYVVGIANEIRALSGMAEAAKVLEESADWIKPMQPEVLQRKALVSVCDAIFDDDDFDGGLKVLQTDQDAAWRSDVLAMLAERVLVTDNTAFRDANGNVVSNGSQGSRTLGWISNVGNAAVPGSIAGSAGGRFAPVSITGGTLDLGFNKSVNFESIFEGKLGGSDTPATQP